MKRGDYTWLLNRADTVLAWIETVYVPFTDRLWCRLTLRHLRPYVGWSTERERWQCRDCGQALNLREFEI